MAVEIVGNPSANKLVINADGAASVQTPLNADKAGYAKILDSNGAPIATTENGALATSFFAMILYEQVDGAALNTNVWTTSASGMTIDQTSGFIRLNAGAATTASSYAILQSIKSIPMYGHLPLHLAFNLKASVIPQANLTIEFGIGTVSGTSAPTDGCFFRYTSAGQLLCVTNYGGVETVGVATLPVGVTIPDVPALVNDVQLYDIILVEDHVQFLMGDVLVADISVPLAQAFPTSAGRLPVFARVYTSGSSPANAPVLSLGQIVVGQEDMVQNKAWPDTLATLGRGCYQSPITAFGQTANKSNSAAPSSATLSNTAAGYATLGGQWQFAAIAGANTDYAIFAYQVPAGYQLFINGLSIYSSVSGAAIAITQTVLEWSLGINASAASLATADGAGTWAPRRIPLGMQGFRVADLIGTVTNPIVIAYNTPKVVDAGRYLHIILQIPFGTATISQIVRGTVAIDGYFE